MPMEMKKTKNHITQGCSAAIGRTMLVHESNVIIWKSVVIDLAIVPKRSLASGLSVWPIISVAKIAKKKQTTNIMTWQFTFC